MDNNASSQVTQSVNNDSLITGTTVNQKEGGRPLIAILIIFIVILLVSNTVFIYLYVKNSKLAVNDSNGEISMNNTEQAQKQNITSTPTVSEMKEEGYEYSLSSKYFITHTEENKYPYQIQLMPNFVSNKVWYVSVKSLDDYRKIYQEASVEGCPGPCSQLIEGDNLEKQFKILNKIANLPVCELNNEVKEDIDNFMLFAGGIEKKDLVDVIYNPNLEICGIKYVAQDGYDFYLGNYEYEAGFIKNEQIIEIRYELFPVGKLKEIDDIWRSIGYNFEERSLSNEGYIKMEDYILNIDLNAGTIKSTIELYDGFARSFSLSE